jgi:hypothetical protein
MKFINATNLPQEIRGSVREGPAVCVGGDAETGGVARSLCPKVKLQVPPPLRSFRDDKV